MMTDGLLSIPHRQMAESAAARPSTSPGSGMRLLIRLAINIVALWLTAAILPDMSIADGFVNLLLVALIFGLVNTFIKPIAKLLTLPLRVVTLGLFTIVVNALMVMLTAWLVDALVLDGSFWNQLVTAILAALIISIVSIVLRVFLPDDD